MSNKHENLASALAAFQTHIPTVEKGKKAAAGKYSYDYADLTDVTSKVLPLLAAEGLAWSTQPDLTEHGFVLRYELRHESGEALKGVYPLPAPNTPPQQLGSALTYARRYALTAVTGVAPGGDDDDAQQAQQIRPAQAPDGWRDQIGAATSQATLNSIYQRAHNGGWLGDDVLHALTARKEALNAAANTAQAE